MEEIVYGIATILFIGGIIGSVIPMLPGPVVTYGGLIILYWFTSLDISLENIWWLGVISIVISILDYYIQIWGVKRMGGGKGAITGTVIGTIVGLFFTPLGMLLGAFVGAFIGAYVEVKEEGKALKIAFGALVGFITGIILKLSFSIYVIYHVLTLL